MFPSTHVLLLLICTLSTLLHALPTSPSPLLIRSNACPSTTLHTPTVPEWEWALQIYCSRHTPTTITRSSPLSFSYELTAYDDKPIKWLFKVWIDGNIHPSLGQGEDTTEYRFPLSTQVCEDKFKAMVMQGKGGGMPKVVCESGGNKLFRGASYREWLVEGFIGQVVWETRQVKGD